MGLIRNKNKSYMYLGLPWKNPQSEQKENCQVKFRTVSSLEVDQLSESERSFSSLYENKHNT